MHRSCPEKETIEKSVFPEETWGSRVPSAHLRGFSFERKVGRFSLVEEKETLRPWDLPDRGQKQRERRMKGGGWTNGGPVSRIVDELISTRMAVLRCLSRQTRFKLAEFEFIPSSALLAILPSIFETDSDFSFRERNRIFFNPLSNFLRSNNCPLFPNVFRETSRSREGRI